MNDKVGQLTVNLTVSCFSFRQKMRMQMMQQQQGMTRPPPPDYKTPMMTGAPNAMMNNAATAMAGSGQTGNMMAGQQQQQPNPAMMAGAGGQANPMMNSMGSMGMNTMAMGMSNQSYSARPGIRPMAPQQVAVGRPSPNGATSPMQPQQQVVAQQQQQRPMMNYQQQQQQTQQQQQGMMGECQPNLSSFW
jgi:hypothetical protein